MENKTKIAIGIVVAIVIVIALAVGLKKIKPAEQAQIQQAPVNTGTAIEPIESVVAEKPAMPIEDVVALPANELISMEEAAKTGTEINLKIKAGTITAEEGEKQLVILRSHIAPPTPQDTK